DSKERGAPKQRQGDRAHRGPPPHANAAAVIPGAPQPTPEPTLQVTTGKAATGDGTCVGVTVTKADGNPLQGCFLTLTDESTGKSFGARTGPKGMGRFCGLIPGRQVTIKVQGPMGKLLAARQLVLKPGGNPVEVQGH